MSHRLPLLGLFASIVLAGLIFSSCTSSPTPTLPLATPTPTVPGDRLSPPVIASPPTQADQGALVYYQVCMACHGDRGQGLTDEWRAVWSDEYGDDSNCWNSECHGPDHPPQGFSIPQTCCVGVIGPGTLSRFSNALELHTYLVETMPWWNPGYLQPHEYWELTAFLLRSHNALPKHITAVDEINATAFTLFPRSAPPPAAPDSRPPTIIIASLLLLAAGVLVIRNRFQ